MASPNVDTYRTAHQGFNRRDYDEVVSTMAEDFTYEDRARGITYRGHDGFKEFMQSWVEAFSNAKVTNPTYIDAGDTVFAQFVARGVNDGPLGDLPATERELDMPMCEFLRYDDEGRAVSGGIYYDQLTIMTQLGHIQQPEAAAAR